MNERQSNQVRKVTFEQEQNEKEEFFLALTPLQRWELALKVREQMRKQGVNYAFKGQKVRVIKNATP